MKILESIAHEFFFQYEYYIGYMVTHPSKRHYYHRHMWHKYGERYCSREEIEHEWKLATGEDLPDHVLH